jgi:curli biogenesis system outer membrane secretion channel CsgG
MDSLGRRMRLSSLLGLALLFAGASAINAPASAQQRNEAAGTADKPQTMLTRAVPAVPGPKRVVSVGKFDSIGAFNAKYGEWDIGGGLSAMLTTALAESGRFIVVERAQLRQLTTEQELKAAGVTNPETGPELGKLAGVQFLIFGAVTEFGADDRGGGFSFGGARGGSNPLSAALSSQSASGAVALDVRIVDASTGQVTEVYKVKEPLESSGFDLSLGAKGMSLGSNQFLRTPLGEAVRRAITQVVDRLVAEAGRRPWLGLVVEVNEKEAVINAGTNSGLKPGDRFVIERIGRKMTDPATGEVLSVRKQEVAFFEVTSVEERIAIGKFESLANEPPRRGDSVTSLQK